MFAVCCFSALVIVMSGYTQRQEFGELEKADLISSITISVCDIVEYSYLSPVPAITTTNLFIPSNLNSLLFSPA